MAIYFYTLLIMLVLIKTGIVESNNLIIENNEKNKYIQNLITINEKGKYTIKGTFNNYSFIVNTSDVILNFINGILNNVFEPIILIENNVQNLTINLYNTKMYSIDTSIIKIKNFDYFQFNAFSSSLKGETIFESNNKYKLIIKGDIFLNKIEKENQTQNINLNITNNRKLNEITNRSLNKNKKIRLKKTENRILNNTVNTLNKSKHFVTHKLNNGTIKRKNKIDIINNSKKCQIRNTIQNKKIETRNHEKDEMNQKINNLNQMKNVNGNITIYWDFIISCNNEINIKNLSIKFIPKKIISKDYFSQFLKNKHNKIKNKQSSNIFGKELNCKIKSKVRIILTMTSWKERILDCYKSIEILLTNSLPPNKLILNLAEEEFPNKNLDLPYNLLSLLRYKNFEIFWVKENNNVFKKLIPTINRYKNDLIITVDDDIIYPNNFIEKIIFHYKKMVPKIQCHLVHGKQIGNFIINKIILKDE